MTPLQIAKDNLAKLQREHAACLDTITEYTARAEVLDAQIGHLEKFIADNTPAEPEPATAPPAAS